MSKAKMSEAKAMIVQVQVRLVDASGVAVAETAGTAVTRAVPDSVPDAQAIAYDIMVLLQPRAPHGAAEEGALGAEEDPFGEEGEEKTKGRRGRRRPTPPPAAAPLPAGEGETATATADGNGGQQDAGAPTADGDDAAAE